MNICIAGATGFIGKELCHSLAKNHAVIALTRREIKEVAYTSAENGVTGSTLPAGIHWRSANLFSLLELERAMEGAEVAVYLVHSMLPASQLTQGTFADLDVILADNFGRAAKHKGVKRIVYLGGIIPKEGLSPHLQSRLEVEHVLAAHGVPLVSLRAGLVIGANSSSFRIMEQLVGRLPIMICPKWTSTRCQAIGINDVVDLLQRVVPDDKLKPGVYDIGGSDVLSYIEMMSQVARQLGVRRRFLKVPFLSRWLSRLWVSTVSRTPKTLVYPLIESLEHDMVARDLRLQDHYGLKPMTFDEAVHCAIEPTTKQQLSFASTTLEIKPLRVQPSAPTVTSVQRLPLPRGKPVHWVASEYAAWLPKFMNPLIKVGIGEAGKLGFKLKPLGPIGPEWLMLELTYSSERSSETRQLYYITGGLLLRKVAGRVRGRLEFRAVPGTNHCIAAVLDYSPSLPWWIYRLTQAKVHLIVMYFFSRYLSRHDKLSSTI